MKININEDVTVTLTEAGEKLWVSSSYFSIGYYNPHTKTLKEQLWVIMAVFGPKFWVGSSPFFSQNEIEINEKTEFTN